MLERIRRLLAGTDEPTTAEGWERYARAHRGPRPLGDEWNLPAALGIDVPADELIAHLDRDVFGPFLGACETLLEIGPGGGRFTEVLLPRCRTLLAADTSPTMLAALRTRFPSTERLRCVALDGHGLRGIGDATVDAAFSFDVFVHLPPWDVFNYLAELRRVLRPGGRAVVHHGNVFSTLGWANFLNEVPYTVNRHKPFGNFSPMTPELFAGFAERAGLRVVACRTDVVRRDAITFLERG